jgi:tetratricopeptide (TPR) repeat protein
LADFLRDLQQRTRARVLLTSRRDEWGWLGELPARIAVPPMPMRERVQLARALADRYGARLEPLDAWLPLLRFTGGNPLTLTVGVGQALRDGLTTKRQIGQFVRRLRAGEAAFDDEEAQGRSRSLGASLAYGFEHAFSVEERARLALLHLFQGFVDVDALVWMGHPDADWSLEPIRGLTRDDWRPLLDRAAEVGLLHAHGGGYYRIHPALPWYFRQLFHEHYPEASEAAAGEDAGPPSPVSRRHATRAYVEAVGALGDYYHDQYGAGNRDVIAALGAEEANLLHARRLALAHEWWHRVTSAMQGLRKLYAHTGRRAEWARLVQEIVPHYVDPATGGPRPGRQAQWSLVSNYRVRLAREARRWAEAERLQRIDVKWNREQAAEALDAPEAALDDAARHRIRTLGASLHELGEILREQGEPACVSAYEEAAELLHRIGDEPAAAVAAFNLGHAYMLLPTLRDLDEAERWYRRSLDLFPAGDRLGRGGCFAQLGLVAYERFKEAREAGAPEETLAAHLNEAAEQYHRALDLTPANAVDALAVKHNQLGNIYRDAGDLARSLRHCREAIRYHEQAGNVYAAAQDRYNMAVSFARAGRWPDALDYARAALRGFQTFGARAAQDIQDTQRLIAVIEQAMQEHAA